MRFAAQFVGRADELNALAAVLSRSDGPPGDQRGAVVTVVGEPGTGKTALAERATAGRRVVWATAREGGGAPPMWLWQQVLRGYGEPLVDSRRAGNTGVDRFRMFDDVCRHLLEVHRNHPAVIVLDDLQWADEESLAFLDFLVPDAERYGLVVLATVRRGELSQLPRHATVIEIGGLPLDAVGQLLTPVAGAARVDPDLVEAVWRHTAGNPFFIGEVDKLLTSFGREDDAAQWRSIVPEGVRSVLARRFARLTHHASRTLLSASELGESINPPLLAAAVGRPLDDVLDDLGAAATAGLVRVVPPAGFAFAHSLIREAARAELLPRDRRDLNRRAGEWLQAQPGEPPVSQIAWHLLSAGHAHAGKWAERAGEWAFAASMYGEAAAWFERAQAWCADDAATRIRLRRAEALCRHGRVDEADREFLAIARAARLAGDGGLLARAALGVGSIGGGFEVRQLDPSQQALLTDAIECLGDADSPLLSMLLARLSIASSLDADHDERAELAERAVAIARRVGDDAAIGAALGAWCDAHAGPADVEARSIASAEMLVVAQRCGDTELELLARRLALVAALEAGDIGLVRRHSSAFSGLADRLRLPQFTWYGRLVEGMLAHLAGDLGEARRLATESVTLGVASHSANAHMLASGALLPAIDRDLGDPGYLDRLIQINTGIPEANRGLELSAPFQAYTVGYGGTIGEVAAGLPGWVEMWRKAWPHDGLALLVGFHLARGAAFVGDVELGAEVEAALLPHAERFALDGTGSVCYGPISGALAALAALRGNEVVSRQRYGQAISACQRIGAPLLQQLFERELAALDQGVASGRSGADDAPQSTPVRNGTLCRDGDVWLVRFGSGETRLKHTKGLADLAALIACPERDIHVFDLIGAVGADRSYAGEVIDASARAAYEQRILALGEQIEAAEQAGHDNRAAALDEERAALIAHLGAALGLGGRPRIAASDVERARKAVTMRVRDACRRIDAALPELGRHLQHSIRTGTWCSYRPETPTDWTL